MGRGLMITGAALLNRDAGAADLTDRQREVLSVVRTYEAGAGELPSSGWLARRLAISRPAAWEYLRRLEARRGGRG